MKIDKLELKHVQHYPFGSLQYRVSNIDFLSDIYADIFSGGIALPEAVELKEPKALELINSNVKITQPVFSIEKNIDTGLEEDVLLGSGVIMGYDIDDAFLSEVKPLLRPLSQLTEEIQHGGRRFIPYLAIDNEFDVELDGLQYYLEGQDGCMETVDIQLIICILEKLHQWHFDLYNLIPNNLAIEKK